MCFFYYFTEIRYRLSYLGVSFLMTFFTSYYYSLELVYLFARPFLHSKHHDLVFDKGFIFTSLTEAFHTTLKICFIWSFLFFLPLFFYQFWCFFTPSWLIFERVRAKRYLFSGTSGALGGGYCFYFMVLPSLLDFLLNFKINTPLFTVQLEGRIDSYVRISSGVFLIVEFVFQMPLLFSLFYFFGLIDSVLISKNRKIFILFFLLLAAFLSPPDPLAELCLFSFFICTFEFFIWIGFLLQNLYQRDKERSPFKKKLTQ